MLEGVLSTIRTIDEIFFLPERRQRERDKRESASLEKSDRGNGKGEESRCINISIGRIWEFGAPFAGWRRPMTPDQYG